MIQNTCLRKPPSLKPGTSCLFLYLPLIILLCLSPHSALSTHRVVFGSWVWVVYLGLGSGLCIWVLGLGLVLRLGLGLCSWVLGLGVVYLGLGTGTLLGLGCGMRLGELKVPPLFSPFSNTSQP